MKIELDLNDSILYSINDYKELMNDNQFMNELDISIFWRNIIINLHNRGIKNADSLILQINDELKRRNN